MKKSVKKQQPKPKGVITELETFICQSFDKSEGFTKTEVEKKRKTDPELFDEGFDYYIQCPFCGDGQMLSQLNLVFHQMASDLFGY